MGGGGLKPGRTPGGGREGGGGMCAYCVRARAVRGAQWMVVQGDCSKPGRGSGVQTTRRQRPGGGGGGQHTCVRSIWPAEGTNQV